MTDYPGWLSAVVFCQGCPWRCGYCHNPHLLDASECRISWEEVTAFLDRRVALLDAVVFSGGEPLAQRGLGAAMGDVRSRGFRVALHTGGAYPDRLAQVLQRVDWVGFDVKAALDDYAGITGARGSGESALASLQLLLESGVAHEVRTTVHPQMHNPDALERLAAALVSLGVRNYALQEFRPKGCAPGALLGTPAPFPDAACRARIASGFDSFAVRRA